MNGMTKVLAAGCAVMAMLFLSTVPVHASDYQGGTRHCPNSWTWSGVTSSASAVHKHEVPGFWRKQERPAGTSSFQGLFDDTIAFLTVNTSGTFSSYGFGCRG